MQLYTDEENMCLMYCERTHLSLKEGQVSFKREDTFTLLLAVSRILRVPSWWTICGHISSHDSSHCSTAKET
jgi:hypothetical protein